MKSLRVLDNKLIFNQQNPDKAIYDSNQRTSNMLLTVETSVLIVMYTDRLFVKQMI